MNTLLVEKLVKQALEEDVGWGDLTTEAVVPCDVMARGAIIARAAGRIAGLEVAAMAFRLLDPDISFVNMVDDGTDVTAGTVIATVEGRARPILTAERVALNFLQRLSGIATETRRVVDIVRPYGTKVVDTRKTTPGLRLLEKYAVKVGGGYNHRFGLDDAVLIKDNHIRIAGGVAKAVRSARALAGHVLRIEVEVVDLPQVREALEAGADAILLDNMDLDTMREAVSIISGRAIVEASGRISPDNAAEVARTGVDIISLGWLTHSVRSLDLSLEIISMH